MKNSENCSNYKDFIWSSCHITSYIFCCFSVVVPFLHFPYYWLHHFSVVVPFLHFQYYWLHVYWLFFRCCLISTFYTSLVVYRCFSCVVSFLTFSPSLVLYLLFFRCCPISTFYTSLVVYCCFSVVVSFLTFSTSLVLYLLFFRCCPISTFFFTSLVVYFVVFQVLSPVLHFPHHWFYTCCFSGVLPCLHFFYITCCIFCCFSCVVSCFTFSTSLVLYLLFFRCCPHSTFSSYSVAASGLLMSIITMPVVLSSSQLSRLLQPFTKPERLFNVLKICKWSNKRLMSLCTLFKRVSSDLIFLNDWSSIFFLIMV